MIVGILCFGFVRHVFASTTTWEQITTMVHEQYESSNEGVSNPDNAPQVVIDENNRLGILLQDYSTYFVFKTENGQSLVELDVTDRKVPVTENEKVDMAIWDDINVMGIFYIVSKLNTIDYSLIDDENLANYGIIFETETVSYEEVDENGFTISGTAEYVNQFSINLDLFEEATTDLRGTYKEDEGDISPAVEASVSLSLEKASANSLDLSINVEDLKPDSTATCNIYLMPEDGTAYPTGESKIIATIDNCVNGKNVYTISDLLPNSRYTYQVELNVDEAFLGNSYSVVGDEYVSFTTLASEAVEEVTNPKTGNLFVYLVFGSLVVSIVLFIVLFEKGKSEKVS